MLLSVSFHHSLLLTYLTQADTSRVIWSYHSNDPDDPIASFSRHQFQGTRSINFLSGTRTPRTVPSDSNSFTIRNSNVSSVEHCAFYAFVVYICTVTINCTYSANLVKIGFIAKLLCTKTPTMHI